MSTSTDVSTRPVLNDTQLAEIKSFADAAKALADAGVAVEVMSDYGTGFKVVDKATLVGVDLLILDWRFNDGSYGEDGFVSVAAITKHDEKVIINDGSTGIRDQLKLITDQRTKSGHSNPTSGLAVQGGLTSSTYYRHKVNGDIKRTAVTKDYEPATTYYLNA